MKKERESTGKNNELVCVTTGWRANFEEADTAVSANFHAVSVDTRRGLAHTAAGGKLHIRSFNLVCTLRSRHTEH